MAVRDILQYIEVNRTRASLDDLLKELRKAGYPEAEIQAALAGLSSVSPSAPAPSAVLAPASNFRKIGAWVAGFAAGVAMVTLVGWGIILGIFEVDLLSDFIGEFLDEGGISTFAILLLILVVFSSILPVWFGIQLKRRWRLFGWGILFGVALEGLAFILLVLWLYAMFGGGF